MNTPIFIEHNRRFESLKFVDTVATRCGKTKGLRAGYDFYSEAAA
ncbi:MAG: hypothetical protein AB1757_30100 [Acidobacteriota bacterium]